MRTAIVDKSNYNIAYTYDGAPDQSKFSGGVWGKSEFFEHISWDETLIDLFWLKAQDDGGGGIELVSNLTQIRANKLCLMREQRDIKLKAMDYMAIDVALGTRADGVDVAAYKTALLDITNPYKDVDGNATDAIDALADDISDLVWPVIP